MFRNSDPPISLFSFQDIVTTLIGIMVLFVLLLSLELIEATRLFEENSPLAEELKVLREKRQSLEERADELRRRREELSSELDTVGEMSEEERRYMAGKTEERLAAAKRASAEVEERLREAEERKAAAEKEAGQLAEREREFETRLAVVEESRRRNEESRRQNQELREEVRRLGNAVSVEFPGDMTKQPVLIECSGSGFRLKRLASQEIREIPFQGVTFTEDIERLFAVLGEYPASSCYMVFLIKPSAANYAEYLLAQFSRRMSSYEMGMDPLHERENCF